MHMLTKELQQTELSEDFVKGLHIGTNVNTDFILQNFQNTDPKDIFPSDVTKQRRNVLTNERNDVVTEPTKSLPVLNPTRIFSRTLAKEQVKATKMKSPKVDSRMSAPPRSKYEGGSLVHRMTRSWLQNLLTGIIQRRSQVPPVGLSVKVAPRAVMKRLCRGQFRCDASIDFHRIVFRNIRLTGGSLEAKHMTLGVFNGGPRYPNQFDIHANNCTLTEDDLFESSCIRNGLARLLVRILSNAGVKTSKIQVTSVNIVVSALCACGSCCFFRTVCSHSTSSISFSSLLQPSGKISCSGQADDLFGSKVSFEVRSGIGMSSRGHIVTFPGLEVSLGPSLGVFVPVVPEIDLDIGHNARLRDVFVDGRRRRVTLSASTTVTPTHTMKLVHKYSQHKDSYSAQFSFDVGRFVTNLGNFTN